MTSTADHTTPFTTLLSFKGRLIGSSRHATQRGAQMAVRKAVRDGFATSGSVFEGEKFVASFGDGS